MATADTGPRRTAAGVAMVVAGVLILCWLVYIGNSTSTLAERALTGLGLAGAALVSVVGQTLVFVGCAMLWRGRGR